MTRRDDGLAQRDAQRVQASEADESEKQERTPPKRMVFTKARLDALLETRPHRQHTIWDSGQDGKGLCALVSRGPKHKRQATVTFRVCYYLHSLPGKPQYLLIGRYPDGEYSWKDERGRDSVIHCSNLKDVRAVAGEIRSRARRGIDPRRPVAKDVVEDVVKDFIDLHAQKNRSCDETQRIFDRYVLPEWRFKKMREIDKDNVTALLDKIEKKQIVYRDSDGKIVRDKDGKPKMLGGSLTASAVLAQISKLCNWHAARTKQFTSPIVKGMGRGKPKARSRVLGDDELRALWPLLDGSVYGAVLKAALLTAQRFHTVSHMRRSDLKEQLTVPGHYDPDEVWIDDVQIDNVWDAGRDDDPENKQVSAVPLSTMVREVIASLPRIDADGGADYVFSLNGRETIKGWSKYKARLDDAMAEALRRQGIEFRPWQQRDLRRTAKVLMKRAGVSTDISERCLAHVIGGVRGIYDRYDYLREKRDAFDRLASLVERIVHPPGNNVVELPGRRAKRRASGSSTLPIVKRRKNSDGHH